MRRHFIIRLFLCAAVFVAMTAGTGPAGAQTSDDRVVDRLDPLLDTVISAGSELAVVKSDFWITEGPNWVQQGHRGFLIFSDIPANLIYKMTEDGKVSVLLANAGYTGPWNGYTALRIGGESSNGKDPNDHGFLRFAQVGSDGLALDLQGRVIICALGDRSLVRLEKNGTRTVLADHYEGKRLNGPNDVVVKSDGSIYFTDSDAGMRLRGKDPSKELDHNGVYRIQDGKLTLVVSDIPTTNGLAFSPDEKYLYANGGSANYIRRYEVLGDGTLTNSQLLIDLATNKAPGVTDGMRVDSEGNIYSSGPGGIWIISPAGKHIGTIHTPQITANLAFGGSDWKTLYITARSSIYKIPVLIPGNHR